MTSRFDKYFIFRTTNTIALKYLVCQNNNELVDRVLIKTWFSEKIFAICVKVCLSVGSPL